MAHEHGLILPGSGLDLSQPATHARRPHGLFSKLWAPWVTETTAYTLNPLTYIWLARNEGVEKKMETTMTITGYIGTTRD